ncbi:transposase [Streptomyces sp. NPDC057429]|uniref:transposase n=1 Tax=Streptomyces sp. NPDC057429 TaxID=3346130 RepID=UPI0036AF8FD5
MVLADKAYSSRAIREHLRKRGIRAVTPVPVDQRGHRCGMAAGAAGHPFDREAYKQRKTVESCINHLKQLRDIATRCEKTAAIYLAGLPIAGISLNGTGASCVSVPSPPAAPSPDRWPH